MSLIKKVSLLDDGRVIVPKTISKLPLDLPKREPTGTRIIKVGIERRRNKRDGQPANGHWRFDKPLGVNGEFGFIYLIRDRLADKMYIGKKQFLGAGKANRGQPTNWPWYSSSCKELCEQIRVNGKDMFEFYVLEQYKNRGTLGYAETWSLMFAETPTNRHRFYNGLVNKVSWTVKETISMKHRERLLALLQNRFEDLELWNEENL
jgi:hypothetical protein